MDREWSRTLLKRQIGFAKQRHKETLRASIAWDANTGMETASKKIVLKQNIGSVKP